MALYDAHELRIAVAPAPYVPSRYAEAPRRWPALLAIVALHGLAVATLDLAGVLPSRRIASELKLIALSPELAPPPPAAPKPDSPVPVPVKLATATVPVPPAPVVQASTLAASVATPNPVVAPPPAAAPAPVAAAPAGPVQVADLETRAVSIVAPKYPLESRRRREQGTVRLSVTLGLDGAVASVSVSQSSGFARLDKAALDAVRRWRWSPTVRGGERVAVSGLVEIPFELVG
jgi:protein TonB